MREISERDRELFKRMDETGASIYGVTWETINAARDWFQKMLLPGEKFTFDVPCDGRGFYDIFAVAKVGDCIMAEFIRNSTKEQGLDTHEISTKGTESPYAMMEAVDKYIKGEGVSEIVDRYINAKLTVIV